MYKIKVLIVDDSSFARNIISTYLKKYDDIEIVGGAADPFEARDLIVKLQPDVITLDIEMPKMSGIDFIKVLMKHYPMPIIVVSSVVSGNCEKSIRALELGAIDVFPKPTLANNSKLTLIFDELHRKIVLAAKSKINLTLKRIETKSTNIISTFQQFQNNNSEKIIAIGASTGGTEAIRKILEQLPANLPPIVISQHMPEGFTKSFANRLNQHCKNLNVYEAIDNEYLQPGTAVIAPGNFHLIIKRENFNYKTVLNQAPKVHYQRPAIDVMFSSIATVANKNTIGILLTGMGVDGAAGLLKIRQAGGRTISQSKNSCVVYGMPREAELLNASEFVLDLEDIPQKIIDLLN